MKKLLQTSAGVRNPSIHKALLEPVAGRLAEAFVFGSVASGTDTSESDIDVAVVGEVDLFDISPLLDTAQAELGRTVHANVYLRQEWAADDPVLAAIKRVAPDLQLDAPTQSVPSRLHDVRNRVT
jgi:uncharacterized protein